MPTSVDEGTFKTESIDLSSDQILRLNTETQTHDLSPPVPVKAEDSTDSSTAAKASVLEESSSQHCSSVMSQKVSVILLVGGSSYLGILFLIYFYLFYNFLL